MWVQLQFRLEEAHLLGFVVHMLQPTTAYSYEAHS